MSKEWINSTLNCEAHSSFKGVYSYHSIVMVKIHLSQYRNKKQTVKIHVMNSPH